MSLFRKRKNVRLDATDYDEAARILGCERFDLRSFSLDDLANGRRLQGFATHYRKRAELVLAAIDGVSTMQVMKPVIETEMHGGSWQFKECREKDDRNHISIFAGFEYFDGNGQRCVASEELWGFRKNANSRDLDDTGNPLATAGSGRLSYDGSRFWNGFWCDYSAINELSKGIDKRLVGMQGVAQLCTDDNTIGVEFVYRNDWERGLSVESHRATTVASTLEELVLSKVLWPTSVVEFGLYRMMVDACLFNSGHPDEGIDKQVENMGHRLAQLSDDDDILDLLTDFEALYFGKLGKQNVDLTAKISEYRNLKGREGGFNALFPSRIVAVTLHSNGPYDGAIVVGLENGRNLCISSREGLPDRIEWCSSVVEETIRGMDVLCRIDRNGIHVEA